jgi:hypothetical protein
LLLPLQEPRDEPKAKRSNLKMKYEASGTPYVLDETAADESESEKEAEELATIEEEEERIAPEWIVDNSNSEGSDDYLSQEDGSSSEGESDPEEDGSEDEVRNLLKDLAKVPPKKLQHLRKIRHCSNEAVTCQWKDCNRMIKPAVKVYRHGHKVSCSLLCRGKWEFA